MAKQFQVYIMNGLKVIGEVQVSPPQRLNLLDSSYSLVKFQNVLYQFVQVQEYKDTLFVFVAGFPYSTLNL